MTDDAKDSCTCNLEASLMQHDSDCSAGRIWKPEKKLDLERLKALCEKMTAPGIDVDLIVSPMMAGLGPETVLQLVAEVEQLDTALYHLKADVRERYSYNCLGLACENRGPKGWRCLDCGEALEERAEKAERERDEAQAELRETNKDPRAAEDGQRAMYESLAKERNELQARCDELQAGVSNIPNIIQDVMKERDAARALAERRRKALSALHGVTSTAIGYWVTRHEEIEKARAEAKAAHDAEE